MIRADVLHFPKGFEPSISLSALFACIKEGQCCVVLPIETTGSIAGLGSSFSLRIINYITGLIGNIARRCEKRVSLPVWLPCFKGAKEGYAR